MEVNIRRASLKDIPYLTKLLRGIISEHFILMTYVQMKNLEESISVKCFYEYVLTYAKEKNYYNVTLNVWADNINAVKFYERIGMRIQKIGMEAIL